MKHIIAALCLALSVGSLGAKTFQFSGYQWEVRPTEESGGPGPNHWDENNAFLDARGYLHLKLTQRDGEWYCSEVYTHEALGFGLYEFSIVGRVDALDPNLVFGLFNYPDADVGPDGTNEIDIEFSHWGVPANPIDNYTVYPAVDGVAPAERSYPIALRGAGQSTHSFSWTPESIFFQSFRGASRAGPLLASWLYQPRQPQVHIPQSLLPVHINLWLFQGNAPTDGQEVDLIVRSFRFTPM